MSEYIEVGQPLQFTDPNTPTRVGEIVENVSDIYNIPSPRLGMQVFVKSEKKSFVITSLKSKVIGGVDVPEAAVEAFEPVGAKSITWNNDTDPSNMDDFVVAGVYDIKGEHTREDDNLPVLNTDGGHSFNARLTVLDSSIPGDGKNDDKCITQVLSFSNRLGQGEVYIRTGKGSSLNNLTWENWSTLQRNVNVDEVTSLDHLIDNGIYSGVWLKGYLNAHPLTFVCIVINDYFIGTAPRRISQFVYGLSKSDGSVVYQFRVWDDSKGMWGDWEILNYKEISSMIKSSVNNAIRTESQRAQTMEKQLQDWMDADKQESQVADAEIRANAMQYDTLGVSVYADKAEIYCRSIDTKVRTSDFPAATTEKAGVMSAADKVKLNASIKNVEVSPNVGDVELDLEDNTGNINHVVFPEATPEKAGVMSAEDKTTLSSVDLNTCFINTTDSDNLINFEKPLYEGYYVDFGGALSVNPNYNVYLVPMSGKSVTINVGGGFVLAAVDKAGKITHVNSENAHSNKTIEYNEGDVYALVSVPKSNNTFVARYADTYISDFTKYNTPVGVNDLEKLDEKCTDVYNVVKNSYQSTVLSPARILKDYNITITNKGSVNLGGSSYNNCYAYNVPFLDKRDYVKINTKTAISSVIGFNSSIAPASSPITVYRNIVGGVNLIITPDELGSNTHIWFACDKDITPDVELFVFSKEEIVIPNNNVDPKETTFFNRNLFNPNDSEILDNTYLGPGGDTNANGSYLVTGFIPFNKDMGKLIVSSDGNTMSASGAAYCLYDANKQLVKGYTYKTKLVAEWEDRVTYARFSVMKGKTTIISIGDTISPYIEYGKDVINNRHIANQYCGVDAVIETIESIADGDISQITKCPYYIKKNVGISMSADLTDMGTVVVGKGYNQYRGLWVEVDNTNIKVYRYDSSAFAIHTAEHGLSINKFIRINVFLDGEGNLQIVLFSNGGCYKTNIECGYEMNYQPFVSCKGASLTNVKLGVSCADVRLPVWVLGDSYLGVASNRWPGIMKDFGFFNVMFDGLSGADSDNMYKEIQRLLSISTPKYIVWCLGMNDTADNYKKVFDLVKQLCENAGVTMIATTIPTVPTRDKEAITNYVKSSGVRYIDMYSAVGATSTGSWHEGMLSSDGVHPTELGAQALAMQVLTDFPEIMQY